MASARDVVWKYSGGVSIINPLFTRQQSFTAIQQSNKKAAKLNLAVPYHYTAASENMTLDRAETKDMLHY